MTYVATANGMTYGGTVPALSGTVTGFVNGQTLATATTGTLAFNTPAGSSSNVGAYAINGSGLTVDNGNYVFQQAVANATAFTISPATLTYVANRARMIFGQPVPGFSGTVTGFVNGQTLQSATSGTLNFSTTATSTTVPGVYGIFGFGLTANNGNYTFVQAGSNASAFTIAPTIMSTSQVPAPPTNTPNIINSISISLELPTAEPAVVSVTDTGASPSPSVHTTPTGTSASPSPSVDTTPTGTVASPSPGVDTTPTGSIGVTMCRSVSSIDSNTLATLCPTLNIKTAR